MSMPPLGLAAVPLLNKKPKIPPCGETAPNGERWGIVVTAARSRFGGGAVYSVAVSDAVVVGATNVIVGSW